MRNHSVGDVVPLLARELGMVVVLIRRGQLMESRRTEDLFRDECATWGPDRVGAQCALLPESVRSMPAWSESMSAEIDFGQRDHQDCD